MNKSNVFIKDDKLIVGTESIDLYRILNIKATEQSVSSFLLSVITIAFAFASIAWMLPLFNSGPMLSLYLSVVLFVIGVISSFFIVKKFSLKIEIKHSDDTGIQWSTVAKSNKKNDYLTFMKITREVEARLAQK